MADANRGRDDHPTAAPAPLTTPIYETTTFLFDCAADVVAFNEGRSERYLYSRYGNPTVTAVERALARLDRAEGALLFGSGMAATAAVMLGHLRASDEVVCSASIYGGTLHLLEDVLARFGVTPRFEPVEAFAAPDALLTDRTRIVWFETPTNPTLRCVDIERVARACRAHRVLSVVDNTFASPLNQQPLALGVDLVMQSATKYLNGHSDVTAGVISGPRPLLEPIEAARRLLGSVLDPHAAYALGRGLKTLELRIARHNASATAIAEHFALDSRVRGVHYPGLASHPDHELATRQMSGFGGMVCFDLGDAEGDAARVFDRLEVFQRAASLGGVESLASIPVLTSHWRYSDAQLAAAGVTRGMLRLSVGLEDPAALIADLDRALD
ncbi:MAG: PLP-dependent aspartate aminotransferase family protein [Vicinamibacterales bacterium]